MSSKMHLLLAPPGSEAAKAATSETKEKLSQVVPQSGPIKLTPGSKKQIAEPAPPPPPPSKSDLQGRRRKPTELIPAPKSTAPLIHPRAARSAGEGYYIQLGALRSNSSAERAWRVVQQKIDRS